jgi:hypothetical protein
VIDIIVSACGHLHLKGTDQHPFTRYFLGSNLIPIREIPIRDIQAFRMIYPSQTVVSCKCKLLVWISGAARKNLHFGAWRCGAIRDVQTLCSVDLDTSASDYPQLSWRDILPVIIIKRERREPSHVQVEPLQSLMVTIPPSELDGAVKHFLPFNPGVMMFPMRGCTLAAFEARFFVANPIRLDEK